MPPRLQMLRRAAVSLPTQHTYQPLAPFLYPFLGQQRAASILTSLSDNPGAYNKRIRVGRGPASGKGKTSGRGHKGQKQHGKVPQGFNGGQTPDWVVAGVKGAKNPFSVHMSPINLNRIQQWVDKGRIDPAKPITMIELNASRCTHGIKDGVKLLARGSEELTSPLHLVVSQASAAAIAAVEKAGGSVTTRYYSKFAVKRVLAREMDPVNSLQSQPSTALAPASSETETSVPQYKYRLPDPTSRKHIEYYRDAAHRGYLSYTVKGGSSPSLFFRTPGVARKGAKKAAATKTSQPRGSENRIW